MGTGPPRCSDVSTVGVRISFKDISETGRNSLTKSSPSRRRFSSRAGHAAANNSSMWSPKLIRSWVKRFVTSDSGRPNFCEHLHSHDSTWWFCSPHCCVLQLHPVSLRPDDVQSLHSSNLGKEATKLGTDAPLVSCLGLFQPVHIILSSYS